MNIYELDRKQIIDIYNTRMVNDFPANELRPLKMILEPYDKGTYICYAIKEDSDDVLGYAFFVKHKNHYLFDYLAISDNKRGSGIGTLFLQLLKEKLQFSDSVIGEVEDPECSDKENDKILQTRRLNFYLRNGYIDTGVRVKLFGVDYIVLEMELNKNHSADEISALYKEHYRNMLPEKLYRTMVYIKLQSI